MLRRRYARPSPSKRPTAGARTGTAKLMSTSCVMPTVHSVPVMPSCLVYSRASRVPPPGKARSFPCTLAVSIVALFSVLVSAAAVSNVIVLHLAVIRMHCRFLRINVIDLGIVDIGDAALELLVLANLTVVILLQIFVCSLSEI